MFAYIGPRNPLLAYTDYLIAFSVAWPEHLRLLEQTFLVLREAGLPIKPSTIQFRLTKV